MAKNQLNHLHAWEVFNHSYEVIKIFRLD